MKKRKRIQSRVGPGPIAEIVVRKRFGPGGPHLARLHAGQTVMLAAIGRTGISHRKREGDGASPEGVFWLKTVLVRKDRMKPIGGCALAAPTRRNMGWCDDLSSQLYNRPVRAGARESHEALWREDHVYDVVIPTSHNERPRVLGAGSAIFMHLARPGYEATQGCVAISPGDMRRLLPRLARNTRLVIKS